MRNQPCPCGSGKKYKKCCGFPKPLQKNLSKSKRAAVVYFLLALGVALTLWGMYLGTTSIRLLTSGEVTIGKVIGYDYREDSEGDEYSCPIYEYTVKSGEAFEKKMGGCNSGLSPDIIYHPDNPELAKINTFSGLFGAPILFVFLGSIFVIVPFFILRQFWKKDRLNR